MSILAPAAQRQAKRDMATTVCMWFSKFQVRPTQFHTNQMNQNLNATYTVQQDHSREEKTSRQDLVEAVAQRQHVNNLV